MTPKQAKPTLSDSQRQRVVEAKTHVPSGLPLPGEDHKIKSIPLSAVEDFKKELPKFEELFKKLAE